MRSLVAAIAFVLMTVACMLPALAHAGLVSADPTDGATLAAAPEALVLRFNEPVNPLAAVLVGLDGTTRPLEEVSALGSDLRISLPADLAPGTHVVSWRAVSEDGHPISGTTSFSFGNVDGDASHVALAGHSEVAPLLWAARIVLYIGLFFGAGGAAFRALSPALPEPARRLSIFTAAAGMAAALLVIGLQGLDLLGLGVGDLAQGPVWKAGAFSVYGQTSLVALGALAAALLGLWAKSDKLGAVAGLVAIVLAGLAVSLSGHASAAQPQWLMKPALFIHMVAIAWWVGALYPLILLLREDLATARDPLLRFSRAIPFAIVPLVLSGVVLALVQLGWPGPAWLSGYGAILAAKLVLLAALFIVASWNRWALTAPAAAGDAQALRHMRRAIVAEIVLVLAILCLVSGWRFTPPPRALVLDSPPIVELTLTKGDLIATILVTQAQVGPVDIDIDLSTPAGDVMAAKAVRISLTPMGTDLAPTTRPAEPDEVGGWSVAGILLPLPGVWTVDIEVRVTDFELVKLSGEIDLTL